MTFTLLILYEWKPGVTPPRIEEHFARIRALAGNVPGLRDVQIGPRTVSFGPDADRWTHGGLMTFERQSNYEAFGRSPAHDKIAPELVADLANLLAVGIEPPLGGEM